MDFRLVSMHKTADNGEMIPSGITLQVSGSGQQAYGTEFPL